MRKVVTTWLARIIAITFCATMFSGAWHYYDKNQQFRTRAEKALVELFPEYTVTTTEEKRFGRRKIDASESITAKISFTTKDKQHITSNRRIDANLLEQFQRGKPVYVEYLPERPQGFRFMGNSSAHLMYFLTGIFTTALTCFYWRKF
jgi:hypothetical protein